VDRQNILNNPYALQEIEKAAHIRGIPFEGKSVVLKEQVAAFFEVNLRTVENYLSKHAEELAENGYEVIRGKRLREFKLRIVENDVPETDFGNISKAPQIGLFDFRAFLNLAMLLTESEAARLLRQAALDIVIDTINQQTGGGTKYINQRDEDFILSYFKEENYRKEFTDALRDCVDMGNFKYPLFTDKIYVSIFNENAQEYRRILRLHEKDKVRDTFYSEVLDLVSAYEYGFGKLLREVFERKGGKLGALEVEKLFEEKLTRLFFSANKFHCFEDGNKRIAISLGAQFLLLNGYVFVTSRFMREMENISYHVAAGRIDKDLLKEIICAVIEDRMDDEELKLKIFHAIDNQAD